MTVGDLSVSLVQQHFATSDKDLLVGGHTVAAIAERYGTPLFVYDGEVMRRTYRSLMVALDGFADIHFSVKANPNPAVIAVFLDEGAGVEIASVGEYHRARQAGADPRQIVFAGPGKRQSELEQVIDAGIGEIHVESFEELDRIEAIGASRGCKVDIAVRINPVAAAQGGAMRMGGKPTAFGFDEEDLDEVVAAVNALRHARLTGVHVFAGTQILDAEVLLAQWAHGLELAERVGAAAGHPLATIDLGGGLGIPYFQGDVPLDMDRVLRGIPVLRKHKSLLPFISKARVIVEPGRFLAGPAGLYVAAVNAVKRSRGQTFVVIDGGMHHHLAASGNLGQVMKRDYPLVAPSRMGDASVEPVSVVGPLCTPLDTLARKAILPNLSSGDLVAVMQSGAYGLTASPNGFLSHPQPCEVMIDSGSVRAIGSGDVEHRPHSRPLTTARL